jgi:parallel beta-helix repeat protein
MKAKAQQKRVDSFFNPKWLAGGGIILSFLSLFLLAGVWDCFLAHAQASDKALSQSPTLPSGKLDYLPGTLRERVAVGTVMNFRATEPTEDKNTNVSGTSRLHSMGLIPAPPTHPPAAGAVAEELRARWEAEQARQPRSLKPADYNPPAVDNSAGLPPIGNQGAQGSCTAWTTGYYMKSYQERKERGWNLNDPAHQFSPAFLYNQVQYFDEGSSFGDNLDLLMEQGCATLATMPYSDADHRIWPSAEAYREAIPFRALSYQYLGHGETPAIFEALKAILISGDVCGFGFPVFRPNLSTAGAFDRLDAADANYDFPAPEDVCLAGFHAVTICGYDESRFGGMGGYKIANSWGSGWGDGGLAWISRRFLVTFGFDFYRMRDRIGYEPTARVRCKVNHPYWHYDNVIVSVGVGPVDAPLWSKDLHKRLLRDGELIDRWADITEAAAFLPPAWNQRWWVRVNDAVRDDMATLHRFEIEVNGNAQNGNVVMPIIGPFFPGVISAFIPAGEAASTEYYVNDDSTAGNVYCSAPGDDANDGLTPATPKRTVESVIERYTLQAGNTVYIDTGYYELSGDIVVNHLDRGEAGNPICLKGALGTKGEPLTRYHRLGTTGNCFALHGNPLHVQLENMSLTGGASGVSMDGSWRYGVDGLTLDTLRISGVSGSAVTLFEAQGVTMRRCAIWGYGGASGVSISRSSLVFEQGLVWGRAGSTCLNVTSSSSDLASGGYLELSDSIVRAFGGQCLAKSLFCTIAPVRYNTLHATDGGTVGIEVDATNLLADPLCIAPASGDFHLQSIVGRWNPTAGGGAGAWEVDSLHSPSIDAGDYATAAGAEPAPNGRRVNAGPYGGTPWASKSVVARHLALQSPAGGALYYHTCPIQWLTHGDGWQAGDTLAASYSIDGGSSWLPITGAEALAFDSSPYAWDVLAVARATSYTLRLVCNQDAGVAASPDGQFFIATQNFYYVNDGATLNDVYCTAPGDDANDGLAPTTPKATLQAILDAYDLEAGDMVYVDTGYYPLSAPVTIAAADGGSAAGKVRIVGSTHPDGSVLDRNNTGSPVVALQAANVSLEHLAFTRGQTGVALNPTAVGCRILFCRAFGNGTGIGDNSARELEVRNCVVYRNNGVGVHCNNVPQSQFINNTLCWNKSHGIELLYTTYRAVKNNILVADGANAVCLRLWGSVVEKTEYNNFYTTGGAATGHEGDFPTFHEPLFVNPDGPDGIAGTLDDDFHLQSTAGSWHGGSWTPDGGDSPCIDIGSPLDPFSGEPSPNGARINLGAYGGTDQASKTPVGRAVALAIPKGEEVWRGTQIIRWQATGTGWQPGDTVKLEYSSNNGADWSPIPSAGALPYADGQFAWDTLAAVPNAGQSFRVRVTCNEDPAVTHAGTKCFMLHNAGLEYYVNDTSTADDVYCTAAGNDANDGLTSATPKATLRAILDTYDLEGGDVVYVDTGLYPLSGTLVFGAQDGGDETGHVRIVGSPHPAGSVLDRNNTANNLLALQASYVSLEHLSFMRGAAGVTVTGSNCRLLSCRVMQNRTGIHGNASINLDVRHCQVYGNAERGIDLFKADGSRVINCTLYRNRGTGIYINYDTSPSIRNNIIVADGAGNTCLEHLNCTITQYVYNNYHVTNGAVVGIPGGHAMYLDPFFVNPSGADGLAATQDDDFHLQSTAGSWHGGAWTPDALDSPCIDLGDPADSVENEPDPNGGRINLGAYGGTAQASRTRAGRVLTLILPNGGEVWRGMQTIHWETTGLGWQANDSVNLKYSPDGGTIWLPILSGEAVPRENGAFAWDTLAAVPNSGALFRVRVTCNQEPAVADSSDGNFTLHNTPLNYYVNDSSTVDDVYCTAAGDDANDGLTPSTPKATLRAILETYDLEPGDGVYVDTGYYLLGATVTMGETDGGSESGRVRIVGSPHPKGSVLDRNSMGSVLLALQAPYVSLENLSFTRASRGVELNSAATDCRIVSCRFFANNTGIYAYASPRLEARNCLIYQNTNRGIDCNSADYSRFINNTFYMNKNYGIYLYNRSYRLIKNNIIVADGTGSTCIWLQSATVERIDFNNLYATGGAVVGNSGTNAGYYDPLFVDADGPDNTPGTQDDDFHLQSTAGSWHGGAWMPDALDSPCIDAGDPADEPADEPAPNGARINLGAWGGTVQASKTHGFIQLYSPNGGEQWKVEGRIAWNVNSALWPAGNTVALSYSADDGASWHPIFGAENLPGETGRYTWDLTDIAPGDQYRLRVTHVQDPATSATSRERFTILQGMYYVNDAETARDQWCLAPGNAANNGLTRATPKNSIQSILDAYDLEPGDVVFIDAGTYSLAANIVVGTADGGSAAAPVRLVGVKGRTLLDHGAPATNGSACVQVNASYMHILHLDCRNAWYGIHLASGADNCVVENNTVAGCGASGIYANNAKYATLRRNTVTHAGSGAGISLVAFSSSGQYQAMPCVVENNTCVTNGADGIHVAANKGPTLKNNIVVAGGAGKYCILSYDALSIDACDYNNLLPRDGAKLGKIYQFEADILAQWRTALGWDAHSLSADPLFADAAAGDYSLQSTSGHWDASADGGAGGWVTDAADSPCIDAGDPTDAFTDEPAPNGARINQGAQGGTATASKSPAAARWLVFDGAGIRHPLHAFEPLRWTARGSNWTSGETVRIELTGDFGATWQPIAGAENLAHDAASHWWDSRTVADGRPYRFRVVDNANAEILHSDQRDYTVRNRGTIVVNCNIERGAFRITGPQNFEGSGLSWTEPNAMLGSYTITWLPVSGTVEIPPAETREIAYPDDTISFTGNYVEGSIAPNGWIIGEAGETELPSTRASRGKGSDGAGMTLAPSRLSDVTPSPSPSSTPCESAQLAFTHVPPYGSHENLQGQATGCADWTDYNIVVYIKVGDGWWIKPYASPPCTNLNPDGSWTADITTGGGDPYATVIAAYLLPPGEACPVVLGGALPPALETVALASARINRYPPGCEPLGFSGHIWRIKNSADIPVGPGPNRFACPNARVDGEGLHLAITQQDGKWYCGEVILDSDLGGYGRYVFHTRGRVDLLDPCMVLGMFTWDDAPDAPPYHREIDFEVSQWCDVETAVNTQYVIQPWDGAGNLERFPVQLTPEDNDLTFVLTWLPGSTLFETFRGHYVGAAPEERLVHRWLREGEAVPVPGGEEVRINLWLVDGQPPLSGLGGECLITYFGFTPAGQPTPTSTPTPSPTPWPTRPPLDPWVIAGISYVSYQQDDYPERTAWEAETHSSTRGVKATRISTAGAYSGSCALALDMQLDNTPQGQAQGRTQGEAWVNLVERPPFSCPPAACVEGPVNLEGQMVSARVFVPGGFPLGSGAAISGIQLLFKSKDGDNYRSFYGPWRSLTAADQDTWIEVSAVPARSAPLGGWMDAGFDPSKVRLLGVKIALYDSAPIPTQWEGELRLDHVTWGTEGCIPCYGFEVMQGAFDQMISAGANWVALVDTWYQTTRTATEIQPVVGKSHSDDELTSTIVALKGRGLRVLMKPHVDVLDESWRGTIRPDEAALDAWFASYEAYLRRCARIAKEAGADMLCLATELSALSTPELAARWGAMAAAARQEFSGPITCALNWDELDNPLSHPLIALCDPVGLDAYYPLSDERDPSLETLLAGWEDYGGVHGSHRWLDRLRAWQAAHGKSVVFTELGYTSRDYAAREPWDRCEPGEACAFDLNVDLQTRCLDAVQRTFLGEPWMLGFFWWNWNPWPDTGGLCDKSFTLQNKPGSEILFRSFIPTPTPSPSPSPTPVTRVVGNWVLY